MEGGVVWIWIIHVSNDENTKINLNFHTKNYYSNRYNKFLKDFN